MDSFDLDLDDIVIFELPTAEDVEAFRERLRPRWDGWSDADGEVWLFTARFSTGGDAAVLLRGAQELVAELGLASIRFSLDGHVYVLEAARSADLAAGST